MTNTIPPRPDGTTAAPRGGAGSVLPDGLTLLQSFRDAGPAARNGIGALIDMRIDEVEEGRVTFRLTTRRDFANPLGTLHGGLMSTMLDSAVGCAVHTTLPAQMTYTTVDLAVKFLRPGPIDGSEIHAEGRVVHRGRRLATADGTLTDSTGRVLATATTTCILLPLD